MFSDGRVLVLVGGLTLAVVGLAVALGVVMVSDHDNRMDGSMAGGSGYAGMMGAMGTMDSGAMLQHMKEVLGDDAYARMLQHMQDHKSGAMPAMGSVDQMMHSMMDGMMGQMGLIPTPTATPTP